MSENKYSDKKALVVRLEAGDVVIERASNYCSSTLKVAHALMHAAQDKDWKVTIEARLMKTSEYDAMRTKFENEATGEMIALGLEAELAKAAESEKGGGES